MTDRPNVNLIRLHADGELTPQQRDEMAAFLAAHPEQARSVQARIDFEKQLRACVNRTMSTGEHSQAPQALIAAVIAALRQEQSAKAAAQSALPVAGRIAPDTSGVSQGAHQRRSALGRLFFDTNRTSYLAVAATLAIIAGAVLFGIFGRQIDQPSNDTANLVAAASLYADDSHGKFAGTLAKNQVELPAVQPEPTRQSLSEYLGAQILMFDLTPVGYEVIESGSDDMPVPERCVHLRYRKKAEEGQRRPLVSVFIVPSSGGCKCLCKDTKPGEWCGSGSSKKCVRKVLHSTDGHLNYFVVCCDPRDLEAITGILTASMKAGSPGALMPGGR